jgi:hypothetical protein
MKISRLNKVCTIIDKIIGVVFLLQSLLVFLDVYTLSKTDQVWCLFFLGLIFILSHVEINFSKSDKKENE